jgi:hypothetical protein
VSLIFKDKDGGLRAEFVAAEGSYASMNLFHSETSRVGSEPSRRVGAGMHVGGGEVSMALFDGEAKFNSIWMRVEKYKWFIDANHNNGRRWSVPSPGE